MAKIYMEHSYIEPHDDEVNNYVIQITVKRGKEEILAGEVECPPKPWIYLDWNEEGDLILNNSPTMEANKWDHITKELIGGIDG